MKEFAYQNYSALVEMYCPLKAIQVFPRTLCYFYAKMSLLVMRETSWRVIFGLVMSEKRVVMTSSGCK